jgi:arabinogalactan oligomer/maltooligosaccharide transport system permease protein
MSFSSENADRSWVAQRLPSKEDQAGLLVLPGLLAYGIFMLYPIMYLVFLSFTNAGGAEDLIRGTYNFIALENYSRLIQDGQFWTSMGVTWLFVFVSVVLKILFSVSLALVFTHDRVRGKRYMRALAIIPLGLPPVFTITVWRQMFSPARFGIANEVYISIAGVLGRNPGPIGWFFDRWLAFMSYVVTELWLAYAFMLIIIVSALQDVSDELHDAAKVDGAGYLQRFIHVTLPAIKRPVWFASILTGATSFQQFLVPFIFNNGGPSRSNEFILLYGYREAFQSPPRMGIGAAIMVIALIFIGIFMWINVRKGQLAEGLSEQ